MTEANPMGFKPLRLDSERANVRFTPEQYARLKAEAFILGQTIPSILKHAYFRREPLRVLMDQTDRKSVFAELRRIGNNVNQIARRVNSGLQEGWHKEFTEAVQLLSNLEKYLVGAYGIR